MHLPVDRPTPRSRAPRGEDDASSDDVADRTGSYVIVIDLA
jgi:hypothetical protein